MTRTLRAMTRTLRAMTRTLRAEGAKVLTTRLWWALAIGVVVWVALQAGAGAALAGRQETPGLDTTAGLSSVWQAAVNAYVFAVVVGVLMMTGEFRHQTATSTFLATPTRTPVILAKAAVGFVVGAGYGAIGVLTTVAVGWPIVALRGYDAFGASVPVLGIMVGAVLGGGLWATVAVGIGALVRSQVAALVGSLVWVMLVEALLVALLPAVGRWLPGGAASALVRTNPARGGDLLGAVPGGLLLLAYAAAFTAAGCWVVRRRDVL